MRQAVAMVLLICSCFLPAGCASSRSDKSIFVKAHEDARNQFADVANTALTEVKYGNKIYLRVVAAGVVCDDERITRYMRGLRDRLVPFVERKTLPYVVTVLNDPRAYAASTPGGFVYVSLGMLEYVTTESELVAVIAHEMAQSEYKPQEFRLSKRIFAFFRSCAGLVKWVFPYGFGIPEGLKVIDRTALGDISPEQAVIRADEMAVPMLVRAGYRPQGMEDLFMHFSSYEAVDYPRIKKYITLRPVTERRIIQVKKMLANEPSDPGRREREKESYAPVRSYVSSLINR